MKTSREIKKTGMTASHLNENLPDAGARSISIFIVIPAVLVDSVLPGYYRHGQYNPADIRQQKHSFSLQVLIYRFYAHHCTHDKVKVLYKV